MTSRATPIFVKTPQPDTEERLVLVPPDAVSRTEGGDELLTIRTANARDATPDDLARGGWVRTPKCLCDAFCDEPCPVHARENALQDERNATIARAEKAERERDDLLEGDMREARTQRERADTAEAERDTLRAELARLTAPGEGSEGEPTDNDLRDVWGPESTMANARRAIYRLGVAHERARQPEKGRATDEELVEAYDASQERADARTGREAHAAGLLAVAARVRQERCLVAQAVAANVDIRVCEDDGGGFMVGAHASGRDEELERAVLAADVPATLARLLGEVSR